MISKSPTSVISLAGSPTPLISRYCRKHRRFCISAVSALLDIPCMCIGIFYFYQTLGRYTSHPLADFLWGPMPLFTMEWTSCWKSLKNTCIFSQSSFQTKNRHRAPQEIKCYKSRWLSGSAYFAELSKALSFLYFSSFCSFGVGFLMRY